MVDRKFRFGTRDLLVKQLTDKKWSLVDIKRLGNDLYFFCDAKLKNKPVPVVKEKKKPEQVN